MFLLASLITIQEHRICTDHFQDTVTKFRFKPNWIWILLDCIFYKRQIWSDFLYNINQKYFSFLFYLNVCICVLVLSEMFAFLHSSPHVSVPCMAIQKGVGNTPVLPQHQCYISNIPSSPEDWGEQALGRGHSQDS